MYKFLFYEYDFRPKIVYYGDLAKIIFQQSEKIILKGEFVWKINCYEAAFLL